MCPVTKCPFNRPPTSSTRSKFTPEPTRANCRFVRSQVSRNRSNRMDFPPLRGDSFTTVRQQPLTARLSPIFNPRAQTFDRTVSSMEPVRRFDPLHHSHLFHNAGKRPRCNIALSGWF